ncbi:MAG: hypothetical protein MR283_02315 [Erysipelotrichaceae bacterium]|nr:hypothetical protein [Erysipelotrichaceae bacterium]MDY6034623.1 hypothetical protein [Bulleidia sp.]
MIDRIIFVFYYACIQTDDWEIKHTERLLESGDGGNLQVGGMQMDP